MSKTTIGGESIRQVTSGQRARVILAVVCAASVMCATSARAQSTSAPQVSRLQDHAQDFPFSDTDPCIGNATVAGQGHFLEQFMDRGNGDFTLRINQNGQGTNVDVPGDTAQYQFNYSNDFRFRSSTPNFMFTTQLRKHIIRQGALPPGLPKDDWFVVESVTLSPLSGPSINSFKSESTCK